MRGRGTGQKPSWKAEDGGMELDQRRGVRGRGRHAVVPSWMTKTAATGGDVGSSIIIRGDEEGSGGIGVFGGYGEAIEQAEIKRQTREVMERVMKRSEGAWGGRGPREEMGLEETGVGVERIGKVLGGHETSRTRGYEVAQSSQGKKKRQKVASEERGDCDLSQVQDERVVRILRLDAVTDKMVHSRIRGGRHLVFCRPLCAITLLLSTNCLSNT